MTTLLSTLNYRMTTKVKRSLFVVMVIVLILISREYECIQELINLPTATVPMHGSTQNVTPNSHKPILISPVTSVPSLWNFYLLKLETSSKCCCFSKEIFLLLYYLENHPKRSLNITKNTLFIIAYYGEFNSNHQIFAQSETKKVMNVKKCNNLQRVKQSGYNYKEYISLFMKLKSNQSISNNSTKLLLFTYNLNTLSLFNGNEWPLDVGRISYYITIDDVNYRSNVDISLPTATVNNFYNINNVRRDNVSILMYKYNISFQGQIRPTYGSHWFNNKPAELERNSDSDKVYNLTQLKVKNRVSNIRYKMFKYLYLNVNEENLNDDYRIYMKESKNAKYIYNFTDLMINSHFCLLIGGDAPWSYRLMEILSAGCVPIYIYNGWILPFNNIINWNKYIVSIPELYINYLIKYNLFNNLTAFKMNVIYNNQQYIDNMELYYNNSIMKWHQSILHLYEKHFINYSVITDNLLENILNANNNNTIYAMPLPDIPDMPEMSHIFTIGFQASGTMSFHSFFELNNISSIHWDDNNLFAGMTTNYFQHKSKVLSKYDNYTHITDFGIGPILNQQFSQYNLIHYNDSNINATEAVPVWYKILDEQYPGSKYILNVRPINEWLISRWILLFQSKRFQTTDFYKHGLYKRYTKKEILALWIKDWYNYNCDVIEYFVNNNKNKQLLVFDIKNDNISKLIHFFKDWIDLNATKWSNTNHHTTNEKVTNIKISESANSTEIDNLKRECGFAQI